MLSRNWLAASGSSAAAIPATARAVREACAGNVRYPRALARPRTACRASARARVGRPARSASSAASAAHQGELRGTGLVARAASRRARLDNAAHSPGSGESTRDSPGRDAASRTTPGASWPNRRTSIAAAGSLGPSAPSASTIARDRWPSARSKARSRPVTGTSRASPPAPAGSPSRITCPASGS